MRRTIAAVLVVLAVLAAVPPEARAGDTATKVALGLASFAVFNQLIGVSLHHRHHHAYAERMVIYTTPVVQGTPRVVYAGPMITVIQPVAPAPVPTVVQYPHGRYELRGDGVTTAYHWVWIPAVPPPPPPPPPPAAAPTPGPSPAR